MVSIKLFLNFTCLISLNFPQFLSNIFANFLNLFICFKIFVLRIDLNYLPRLALFQNAIQYPKVTLCRWQNFHSLFYFWCFDIKYFFNLLFYFLYLNHLATVGSFEILGKIFIWYYIFYEDLVDMTNCFYIVFYFIYQLVLLASLKLKKLGLMSRRKLYLFVLINYWMHLLKEFRNHSKTAPKHILYLCILLF